MRTLIQKIKGNTWFNNLAKTKEILLELAGGSFIDAPSDGEQYVRQDGAWEIVNTGSTEAIKKYVALVNIVDDAVDDLEEYYAHPDLQGMSVSLTNGDTFVLSKTGAFTLSGITHYPKVTFSIKRLLDNNDVESSDTWLQNLDGDEDTLYLTKFDGTLTSSYHIIEIEVY